MALTSGTSMPTATLHAMLVALEPPASRIGWSAARLAAWAAVAGVDVELEGHLPPPFDAMHRRDWPSAAEGFGRIGWEYDRALMLSLLDDDAALDEAAAIAARLGAAPLAARVDRQRSGVTGVR